MPKSKGTTVNLIPENPEIKTGNIQVTLNYGLCLNGCMATLDKDDLIAIKGVMQLAIEDAIEEKSLVTKEDISHLPTKDEFYTKMDEVMGELKTIREEQAVQSHQLSDHGIELRKSKPIWEYLQTSRIFFYSTGRLK